MSIVTVEVKTVYGCKIRIAVADLLNTKKIMLPIYVRDGVNLYDTVAYQRAKTKPADFLHRENIALTVADFIQDEETV